MEVTIKEEASSSRKRSRTSSKTPQNKPEEIQREQKRRAKMSDLYSTLQSMVPNISPKAPRAKIVDEVIGYITELEQVKIELEKRKKETEEEAKSRISLQTHLNSSVEVTISGNVVLIGVESMVFQRSLAMEVFMVVEKHKAQVLAANVVEFDGKLTVTVTALVNGDGHEIVERIKRDILLLFSTSFSFF